MKRYHYILEFLYRDNPSTTLKNIELLPGSAALLQATDDEFAVSGELTSGSGIDAMAQVIYCAGRIEDKLFVNLAGVHVEYCQDVEELVN